MTMNRLRQVTVTGFKSIREMDLELGDLTVLIGANGAGKSNFVSLLRMLNFAMTGALQQWIGESGGADSILHYGSKTTPQMTLDLEYETDKGTNRYHARLFDAAPDTLVFADETVAFTPGKAGREGAPESLGSGHRESAVPDAGRSGNRRAAAALGCMRAWQVYQFHDTSASATIRKQHYKHDNRYLRSDGGNLAAFLYGLRETKPQYYERIVKTIRLAAPFFDDFDLEPLVLSPEDVMLNWREVGRDYLLRPHHISDGALRFMTLTTLLLQPEETLPELIVIDEPELGLHPYAISLLGSMVRSLRGVAQVILATQSVPLLDEFEPGDVVVVDRHGGESLFAHLEPAELTDWLDEYSLSELWEKNVIGGRPGR